MMTIDVDRTSNVDPNVRSHLATRVEPVVNVGRALGLDRSRFGRLRLPPFASRPDVAEGACLAIAWRESSSVASFPYGAQGRLV